MDRVDMLLRYWKMCMMNQAKEFFFDEEGDVNIVSIIVLIGIVIIVALIFKNRLSQLVGSLFDTLDKSAQDAITE